MKLVTFDHADGAQHLGALLPDGAIMDLTAAAEGDPGFASMLALIDAGPDCWDRARDLAAGPGTHVLDGRRCRLRAPLPVPAQLRDAMAFHKHIRQGYAAGLRLQARASGQADAAARAEAAIAAWTLPDIHLRQPVYYKGNRFSIAGPDDDIQWPAYSTLMDFELELACVIGKPGKDIARETALSHVFGFTIFNDFSARDAQAIELAGLLGPAKGKDFDKANAFGPCLVTLDEIGDPQALRMQARVNGETLADGSSAEMAWTFADLIAFASSGETLRPGEIIGSGTLGDGCGFEHLRFLQHGDIVELEIEKIGVLRNRVVCSV